MPVDNYLNLTGLSYFLNKIITNLLSAKQDTLVSGTNIKTVNGNSLLGSGNININDVAIIERGLTTYNEAKSMLQNQTKPVFFKSGSLIHGAINTFYITDTNITVHFICDKYRQYIKLRSCSVTNNDIWSSVKDVTTFPSVDNLKTINNESIVGSGNINIEGGDNTFVAVYETTTYAQLSEAVTAGKIIVIEYEGNRYIGSVSQNADNISVSVPSPGNGNYVFDLDNSNTWQMFVNSAIPPVGNPVAGDIVLTDENGMLYDGYVNVNDLQNVFVAKINTATYNEIKQAIDEKKVIVIQTSDNSNYYVCADYYYNENLATLIIASDLSVAIYTIRTNNSWSVDFKTIVFRNASSKATDTDFGVVKTNASQNITLDAYGKLVVGGRLGQFQGTTGIYASNDRDPRNVGDYSFLITDALGMDLNTNRAFALVSGYGQTCKSAAAGATEYRVANNYQNRIICKMVEGGYASINEATSKIQRIIPIVSVTINGSSFTPDSSADSSTNDIVIKTSETLNPDGAITNIRLFGKMQSYSTAHIGNGIKSEGGGRNILLGGGVTKAGSSNDNCLIGMAIYSSGNGNACFGRQHIARKNRGLLAGTGHDTTNAQNEGVSAVGQFSFIDAYTIFAVGNGTSHRARSNAFEVRSDGIVLKSPNGTRYKLSVDDSGNLTTTAI